MNNGSRPWNPRGDVKLIYDFLPEDTSRQTHSLREALRVLDNISVGNGTITLLDLGCGAGGAYDVFSARNPRIRWIGLDIMDSREVALRPFRTLPFCTYDGIRLPLADGSVDIGYSQQVFEHVRHPELLISEVHRVLKHDGVFVGSTSHLEPFHSRSYWNYTPYGFCVLLREAGFHAIMVRPGIDCLTLIARRYLSYLKLSNIFEPFFTIESPMNLLVELGLRVSAQSVKRRNAFKLLFAGQFCFVAQK
jgi:SAM-dependent methyltransferase